MAEEGRREKMKVEGGDGWVGKRLGKGWEGMGRGGKGEGKGKDMVTLTVG